MLHLKSLRCSLLLQEGFCSTREDILLLCAHEVTTVLDKAGCASVSQAHCVHDGGFGTRMPGSASERYGEKEGGGVCSFLSSFHQVCKTVDLRLGMLGSVTQECLRK